MASMTTLKIFPISELKFICRTNIKSGKKYFTPRAKYLKHTSFFNSFDVMKRFNHTGLSHLWQRKESVVTSVYPVCKLCTSSLTMKQRKDIEPTAEELVPREQFFDEIRVKDKSTFLLAIKAFSADEKIHRGQVEFIYAALNCMEEFGVERDLEVYKKLMNIFPKGKMIPRSIIQAEFYHFPRQQECAIFLLDTMECNCVHNDEEMRDLILNIFGRSSHVFKKYARMMYWMPKLRNINPYMLPDPMPSSAEELAKLALKKMSVDPRTKLTHFKAEDLEDSIDNTWIVSAQSPVQMKLIDKHPVEQPLYVEGSFLVWLSRISISYFYLRATPEPRPECEEDSDSDDLSNISLHVVGGPKPASLALSPSTVHEQEDGVIMAMCATGTSSKDSLLSWIRFLQKSNSKLSEIPIIFKIRSPPTALSTVNVVAHQRKEGDSQEHENYESSR